MTVVLNEQRDRGGVGRLVAASLCWMLVVGVAGCTGQRTEQPDSSDETEDTTVGAPDVSDVSTGGADAPACFDSGVVSNPDCSEPATCPAPDSSVDPEVTCWEPRWTEGNQDITLEIYGRHLVKSDGTIDQLTYRSKAEGGAGRIAQTVEVQSDCHVTVTLPTSSASWFQCGATLEFKLQRDVPTQQEYEDGERASESGWHEVRVTEFVN